MNVHELTLQNYTAASGCPSACQPILYLGTAGSYGNEQLAVTLGKGWEGLTVTATFQPAGVTVLVPGDGTLDVPWEATETALDAAKGRIVFEGVTDGRVLISTDIPYAVGSHSDTEGSNSQPPTPSQWEQFVNEVKGDAGRAEQAAKDAEATLQDVKDAGAQAVTDIGAAKNSALDAISKAGEEVAGSITAAVQAAKDAAAAAEQSAKDAAAELPKVQQAGQTALDDIATERENSLSALEDEGDKQQSAVAGAGASALEAIQQAGQTVTGQITQSGATQVGAVQSAGSTQVGLVNSAGQQQAENIAQAGSQQVQAVQTAGTAAVDTVNNARDDAVEEIETANAHSPQINQDTGYWQTWDAETGEYVDTTTKAQGAQGNKGDTGDPGPQGETGATPQLTIGTVTTLEPGEDATANITGTAEAPVLNFGIPKGEQGDGSTSGSDLPATTAADSGKAPTVNAAGTGYELTGPYAPLSAAIIETVKGNPAVCNDGVAWGLQGLKVYGKSTQFTTTGAQLFKPFTELHKVSIPDGWTFGDPFPIDTDGYYLGMTTNGYWAEDHLSKFEYNSDDDSYTISNDSSGYGYGIVVDLTNIDNLIWSFASPTFLNNKVGCSILDESGNIITYNTNINIPEISSVEGAKYLLLVLRPENEEITYVKPMLNTGSTSLPWEPYTGGMPSPSPEYPQEILSAGDEGEISITVSDSGEQSQSLTFSTPDGLPGIPVDSGGNFVDADGQQWICNYRNYDAKKDIKAIEYIASYNDESVGDIWMSTTGQLTVGASVLYTLDTPIETPIPADELAAYRSLHTYDGTTVLTPDNALASLEVDYIVKPKAYIEKKLTAIEQKIQEVAAAQIDTQTGG